MNGKTSLTTGQGHWLSNWLFFTLHWLLLVNCRVTPLCFTATCRAWGKLSFYHEEEVYNLQTGRNCSNYIVCGRFSVFKWYVFVWCYFRQLRTDRNSNVCMYIYYSIEKWLYSIWKYQQIIIKDIKYSILIETFYFLNYQRIIFWGFANRSMSIFLPRWDHFQLHFLVCSCFVICGFGYHIFIYFTFSGIFNHIYFNTLNSWFNFRSNQTVVISFCIITKMIVQVFIFIH